LEPGALRTEQERTCYTFPMRTIPESEIVIDYARASGPGGQNVNKRDTKAVVRWRVSSSKTFSETEKRCIRKRAKGRLNASDEIVFSANDTRSQAQNREKAISRLRELVEKALVPAKRRKPTRPTRASKERRLEEKRLTSRKKALRKQPSAE